MGDCPPVKGFELTILGLGIGVHEMGYEVDLPSPLSIQGNGFRVQRLPVCVCLIPNYNSKAPGVQDGDLAEVFV